MRLRITLDDRGIPHVTDADTGAEIEGVWRVEFVADASARPRVAVYLDPDAVSMTIEDALTVDAAQIDLIRHPRPASHFRG